METIHLKPYDILLYKGDDFMSWFIEAGTTSPYSHVAVVVEPKIFLGIESNVGHQAGVRATDLRKIREGKADVFRVKSEFSYNGAEVVSFLVDKLGAKYDFRGVLWLGALKAASLATFGAYKGYNQFQKDQDYFCSELVYEAFMKGGLDIVPQVDSADTTSPGDFARSERLVKVL